MQELKYTIIDESNLEQALSVQNLIFPNDSALNEYTEAIQKKGNNYFAVNYIVSRNTINNTDDPIGVTGLYSKHENDEDIWLGFFGVLKDKRNFGFGTKILLDTENKAKELGYTTIRLYTNKALYPIAYEFYKKLGYHGERYTRFQKNHIKEIMEEEYIFSKNIAGGELELWNNRYVEDIDKYYD